MGTHYKFLVLHQCFKTDAEIRLGTEHIDSEASEAFYLEYIIDIYFCEF